MAGTRAAIRYAKAILDMAKANNNEANVNVDMNSILTAVKDSDELKDFLKSPVISGTSKFSALSEIFATAQNETKGLFRLLLENKRFGILLAIVSEYNKLSDEDNGLETVAVTTAVPLTSDLESKVLAKIKEFSKNKITINNIVDPSIIGGFIIRMGDKQYNASVANRLQQLKREFSN
ncbi:MULTISPECIES: ATP synthase F1 subunit delta [Flavobacterium]|uniref:ATP synthase subunit delta n=1 Tax=Flavobacterium jumunjinense TaxID=998845 RepID=A0ABV5GSU6_9FLAO|nr:MULTISPECIES: ATP synthase F1 subunit delta [Flavobacterium]